jgi:hypothetical protein
MTRRKSPDKLRKLQPPNPANMARKLRRIRFEIVEIVKSIDQALARLDEIKTETTAG